MNIIDVTTRERGTTILISSSRVDSMSPAAANAVSLDVKVPWAVPVFDEPVH